MAALWVWPLTTQVMPAATGSSARSCTIVDEVEDEPAEIDEFSFGQFCAGAIGVDVAADGGDRSDLSEARKDADIAYVSCVKDMVNTAQRRQNFGTKLGVGVRDDADAHRLRS